MVTKKIFKNWGDKLIEYYKNTSPFDEKRLMIDTIRLCEMPRLYRVLCSCSYLGENKHFAGGVLTKDILKATGWKLPDKATAQQIAQDKIISKKLEERCRDYVSQEKLRELCKKQGLVLPVEWRMFYMIYVPATIFTSEELLFMRNNPCWMLPIGAEGSEKQA